MLPVTDRVVQIENICKVFRVGFWGRRVTAVDQLSLDVRRDEVFGFLGPNGAGKTTTLKMLMGLIYPTSGQARIFGHPVGDPAAKAKLGFLPESPYFYDYLTSQEFLSFYGHLFGLWGPVLNKWDRLVLSGGLVQKVGLLREWIIERIGGPYRVATNQEETLGGLAMLSQQRLDKP